MIELVSPLSDSLDALSLSASGSDAPNDSSSQCAGSATDGSSTSARAPSVSSRSTLQDSTPWIASLVLPEAPSSTLELLDAELLAFHDYMSPTADEIALRRRLNLLFELVVKQSWPDAEVKVFGSMATGLFLPDGDIDLTILCPSFGKTLPRKIFEQLAGALISYSIISSRARPDCELVLSARVPILKFTTTRALGSFSVDVSLDGTKGVAGANVSRALLSELEGKGKKERAERLVLLWKTFLRAHGVNEVRNGGLGGLSSFLMVVSYLQLEPSQHPTEPPPSAGLDWLNFVQYYAFEFNYRDHFFSTDDGGYLGYKKDRASWLNKTHPDRLSIKHPVDHTRDLASGSYGIDYIKDALKKTCTLLARIYTSLPASSSELNSARNQSSALLQIGIELSSQVLERRASNRAPETVTALDQLEVFLRRRGEALESMRLGRERALVEKRERERALQEKRQGVENVWEKLGLSKEVWEKLTKEKEERERAEGSREGSRPVIKPHFPALVPPRSNAKGPIPLIKLASPPNFPKEMRQGSPNYIAAMQRVEEFNKEAKRKNKLIRLENRKLVEEQERRRLPADARVEGEPRAGESLQSASRAYSPAVPSPPIHRLSPNSIPYPPNHPPPSPFAPSPFSSPNAPPRFAYPNHNTYSYTPPQISPPPNHFYQPSPPTIPSYSSPSTSSYPDYFAHPPRPPSQWTSPPTSPPTFLPPLAMYYGSYSATSSPPEPHSRPLPPPPSQGKGMETWSAPSDGRGGDEGWGRF
ncbi:hypothetical protein BCR35DRAFT_44063 [Leucosporidium creatinivorum]|uniref:polynucleotide adenylyltransferase n=1 Tax=Leucosporidium creatinivorum TaxID=106004 RepID=A0A1Y2FTZ0_9BASI|nr:hypothetical protein BCR35DRAFT_44063 [Leucosporidium creatinivorum]